MKMKKKIFWASFVFYLCFFLKLESKERFEVDWVNRPQVKLKECSMDWNGLAFEYKIPETMCYIGCCDGMGAYAIYREKRNNPSEFVLMEGYVDSAFVNNPDSLILKNSIQEYFIVDFATNPKNPNIRRLVIDKGANDLFSFCKSVGFDYFYSNPDSIRCCGIVDYVIGGERYLFSYSVIESHANFCLEDMMKVLNSITVKSVNGK